MKSPNHKIFLYPHLWGMCLSLAVYPSLSAAATLSVGPGYSYATPCAAVSKAAAGDTILIYASGNYSGDVCSIPQSNLTLQGVSQVVNGVSVRPHIDAAGKTAADKGIWVVDGNNVTVDNIEFSGAISSGGNGAGIRAEGGNITVRNSYFHNNQMGILTANLGWGEVWIETSEFAYNGTNNGYTHNIYVGEQSKFTMQFCWSHDAYGGQLVKTRAAENHIQYNRLTGQNGSNYEVDIPNGGLSYVIGNLIQQAPNSSNSNILAYMLEGTSSFNPSTQLYVVNNTFVNNESVGTFVNIASGAVPAVIQNNIFNGPGTLTTQSNAVLSTNFVGNPLFVNPGSYDYHLQSGSPAINAGSTPSIGLPAYDYVQPTAGETRNIVGTVDIGAYEYGGSGTPVTGTTPVTGGATSSIYLNAGGATYTDAQNTTWAADTSYSGGATYITSSPIAGTTSSPLYQSVRYGSFAYNVPVPSGNYTVVLKFAEVYWTAAGKRVFNVAINGQNVLQNFDIVAQAGGAFKALDKQFTVSAVSGQIGIQFTSLVDNACVSAIAIVPSTSAPAVAVSVSPATASLTASQTAQFTATVTNATSSAVTWSLSPAAGTVSSSGLYTAPATITSSQTVTITATSVADTTKSASGTITLNPPASTAFSPIRVNAGGPAYTDSQGRTWSADTGYSGGATYYSPMNVGGTTTPVLYQTVRYLPLTYSFSVPNGTHTVTLKFAEIYFTQPGQRVFNVLINGQAVLSNFDIVQQGGAGVALDEQFTVNVTNGQVTIQLTPVVENPMISAIEIL